MEPKIIISLGVIILSCNFDAYMARPEGGHWNLDVFDTFRGEDGESPKSIRDRLMFIRAFQSHYAKENDP